MRCDGAVVPSSAEFGRQLTKQANMIRTLFFDLSDVLVVGLTGIEEPLHLSLAVPKDQILRQFRSDAMHEFLLGQCTEDAYLHTLRRTYGWTLGVEQLKAIIRAHFKQTIPGTGDIVVSLARHYPLVLLSDHGREWVEYIEAEHPVLGCFQHRFYSCDLHLRKNNPETYRTVLHQIDAQAEECLFIDDRRVFLEAAKQVGLNVIQFENSNQLRRDLRRYSIIV